MKQKEIEKAAVELAKVALGDFVYGPERTQSLATLVAVLCSRHNIDTDKSLRLVLDVIAFIAMVDNAHLTPGTPEMDAAVNGYLEHAGAHCRDLVKKIEVAFGVDSLVAIPQGNIVVNYGAKKWKKK